MTIEKATEQAKKIIHRKYSILTDDDLDDCLNFALSDYLTYKFPSSKNRPELEDISMDFAESMWLPKRMIDILERAGFNIKTYHENGIDITYGASYIDPALVKQIMGSGSIPR